MLSPLYNHAVSARSLLHCTLNFTLSDRLPLLVEATCLGGPTIPSLPGTFPILATKVLYLRNPLGPAQTRTVGYFNLPPAWPTHPKSLPAYCQPEIKAQLKSHFLPGVGDLPVQSLLSCAPHALGLSRSHI